MFDDASISPTPFIDLNLPDTSNSASFSSSTFKGMRTSVNGGFLSASGSGSVFLTDILVSHCEGFRGGALAIAESVKAFVSGSEFLHNKATNGGGGFFVTGSSDIQVQSSTFSYNAGQVAGAFYCTESGGLMLLNSEFSYN